jgi:5-carboxymethyl-2-hydroxymuconate isomerase
MPHCILEYSNNILDQPDVRQVLRGIHDVLAGTELFSLNDIKSRAVKHDDFFIGDGDASRAFVALTIQILSGRSGDVKADISRRAFEFLKQTYPQSIEELKCSITVQIVEIDRASYRR